jgi:hypothetical protein
VAAGEPANRRDRWSACRRRAFGIYG